MKNSILNLINVNGEIIQKSTLLFLNDSEADRLGKEPEEVYNLIDDEGEEFYITIGVNGEKGIYKCQPACEHSRKNIFKHLQEVERS